MGINSASKTVKQRNQTYEEDNIIFPSWRVYSLISSIDRNLQMTYSEGTEECDYHDFLDSPVRNDSAQFKAVLSQVERKIKQLEKIKDNTYKEKQRDAFSDKFGGINLCYIEAQYLATKKAYFRRRIKDIVRRLAYMGIDPNIFRNQV